MSNEQLREALQRIQYKAVSLADAQVIALEALASQTTPPAAPSQEPAVPQGWTDADSDAARLALELECLLLDTENLSVVSKWWASANEALELHRRRLATPAAPSQEPALHIGACITNGVLHATVMRREANGHVTILATAEMDAKSLLEHDCVAKLSPAAPSQGPVTDEYAGVIAWVGDKQCKRVITEGAIKHEHTPGVAMRNAAHQCVQEVIITALREKEGK